MGQTKRHHFISRFYLNGFADSHLSKGDKRFLWMYEKDGGLIRKVSTKNAGVMKDFHTLEFRDQEKDTQSIEEFLSPLEGACAEIVRTLESDHELDSLQKNQFSHFIAVMLVRVPNYRRQARRYLSRKREQDEDFAHVDSSFADDLFWEEVADSGWKLAIMDSARKYATLISRMRWFIARSTDGHRFVTSDNPVYYNVPGRSPKQAYSSGLLSKDVSLTFPISKHLAVVAGWGNGEDCFVSLTNNQVNSFNRGTVISAKRWVYASFKSKTFNESFVRKYAGSEPEF